MNATSQEFLRKIPVFGPLAIQVIEGIELTASYSCYLRDFLMFGRLIGRSTRFQLSWQNRYPCLRDRTRNTYFDRHQIYYTAWAARTIAQTRPKVHVDIASDLYFSSLVSAFVTMRFFDIRPPNLALNNLTVDSVDLVRLPFEDESVESLSCMHTIEHVGLGRYGDNLDPDGDLKALSELRRVLSVGGTLLIVVPVGRPTIRFNAHRVYSYRQILHYLQELELVEFALVPDEHTGLGLIRGASEVLADEQDYGCGCFWFRKQQAEQIQAQ